MSLDDLKREALKLSCDEREEFARTELPAEVKRRYQAYQEGKTKAISLEELMAGIEGAHYGR